MGIGQAGGPRILFKPKGAKPASESTEPPKSYLEKLATNKNILRKTTSDADKSESSSDDRNSANLSLSASSSTDYVTNHPTTSAHVFPHGENKKRKNTSKAGEFDWDSDEDTGSLAVPSDIAPRNKNNSLVDRLMNRGAKGAAKHWSDKHVSEMTDQDWKKVRTEFSIAVRGNAPPPLRFWSDIEMSPRLGDVISSLGYETPSAIQRQAIPIAFTHKDLIGIAETGSGKTASFLIPIFDYVDHMPTMTQDRFDLGPYAIVLAPTRELAQQIESEAHKFASKLGYKALSLVGGKSIDEQMVKLRQGAHVVIATPGRLKDCLEKHIIVFSQCSFVVLDEADRMLSMGFEQDLVYILDTLPEQDVAEYQTEHKNGYPFFRQTLMFSATMPPPVERLARKYMRDPLTVSIGNAGQAVDRVVQRVDVVPDGPRRLDKLLSILSSSKFRPPIIVFVNQKASCDLVDQSLSDQGFRTVTLHSGKSQQQREAALSTLRSGRADILVGTDVAGRGIDIPDVSLVVNYHMPSTIQAYIHRIGRTGRAGKSGTAITFVSDDDADVLYDLKEELEKSPISSVPYELKRNPAAQFRAAKRPRQE